MSEPTSAICYIIQATKEAPLFLCVLDRDAQEFHRYPITVASAARLASECSEVVHAAICGYSQKHAFEEVAAELSRRFGEK